MKERIERNLHLLESFPKLNRKQQGLIRKNFTPDQLKFIFELAINLLNQNIPVPQEIRKKLEPHKSKIRRLSQKNSTIKEKRKIVQTGGFLPLFLSTLASSAVLSALENYIKSGNE
jgi:hypothetical protein